MTETTSPHDRHRRGRRQRRRPRPRRGRRGRRDRRRAGASASCSSGPAGELGEAAPVDGVEVVDAPVSIAKAADPARAARAHARGLDRAGRRAVAAGDADALVSGGSTGAALAAGLFNIKRAPRHPPPGARAPGARPRRAGHAARRRRQHRGAPRAPRPVRASWAPRSPRPCSASSARASALLSQRRGGDARARRWSSRPTPRCATASPQAALRLRRQRRGQRDHDGRRRRGRHRRLHRQRRAEAHGGRLAGDARARSATPRRRRRAREGRRPAAAARAARRSATSSTPRAPAAPTCSACAGSASCRTAASRATASRRRSCSPRAASAGDVVGRTHAALEAAGRAAPRPPAADGGRPSAASSVSRAMTREEVFALIQTHLADELDLDPARIDETTRFKRGPRGRLAGPLHARPGARGLLRREDVRRAGGADPHRGPGRRLRPRPRRGR